VLLLIKHVIVMYRLATMLRALATMGETFLESLRTAIAAPLEGSDLVAGEWTSVHPRRSAIGGRF
jgi:hypothetical protein